MTPFNPESVQEKLAKLQEIIAKLEQDHDKSYEEFLGDSHMSDATMHNLTIGIGIVVDIGNHILSEVYKKKADSYSDVVGKLGQVGVLPEQFALENVNMPKFRNVLVHEYASVELEQVYANAQKAPNILRQFAHYYSEFLEKHSGEHK